MNRLVTGGAGCIGSAYLKNYGWPSATGAARFKQM
jgi:dTDP-D-glucose 4,6-dehydratase